MQISVSKNSRHLQDIELAGDFNHSLANNLNYFIGRSHDCHVIIDDQRVSRNHAQINFSDGKWKIKKLTNFGELFVNGMPISEQQLVPGDIVQLSNYQLAFEFPEPDLNQTEVLDTLEQNQEPVEVVNQQLDDGEFDSEDDQSDEEIFENEKAPLDATRVSGFEETGEIEQTEFQASDDDNNDTIDNDQSETSFEGNYESGFDDVSDNSENEDFDDGFESDVGEKTQIVKSFVELELDISGEYTNFDKFYINRDEVFIGRDPNKCQIVLDDPESSQVHAVLKRTGVSCVLEDLNSSNGTILNGKRINQATLVNDDEFLIGSTSFRLIVKSQLISSERDSLMPVEKTQQIEVEEIIEEEVDFLDDEQLMLEGGADQNIETSSSNSLFSKDALKDPEKRKRLLIIGVVLLAVWVLLDEEPKKTKPKSNKEQSVFDKRAEKDKAKEEQEEQSEIVKGPRFDDLTDAEKQFVVQNYELAKTEILAGNFADGLRYLDNVFSKVGDYERARELKVFASEELKKLEIAELDRQKKIEEEKRKIRINEFLAKAQEAFNAEPKQIELTKTLINKIVEIDPENIDASNLKLQLDSYIKEEEQKAVKEAAAKARRQRLVNELAPGKTLFLKERWYQAIIELSQYLDIKDNDDDLIKEATQMLKESQQNLRSEISPLLGKARSLKEGQDLKGAYETYREVLQIDPNNVEAINERNEIKQTLELQSRRVFREALIDESLTLLKNAKEKYQEVQQISPTDSEYYKRSTKKLRNYLE